MCQAPAVGSGDVYEPERGNPPLRDCEALRPESDLKIHSQGSGPGAPSRSLAWTDTHRVVPHPCLTPGPLPHASRPGLWAPSSGCCVPMVQLRGCRGDPPSPAGPGPDLSITPQSTGGFSGQGGENVTRLQTLIQRTWEEPEAERDLLPMGGRLAGWVWPKGRRRECSGPQRLKRRPLPRRLQAEVEPQRPRGDPRLAGRFLSPLSPEGRAARVLGVGTAAPLRSAVLPRQGPSGVSFWQRRGRRWRQAEVEAGGRACSSLVDLLTAACVDGWPGRQAVRQETGCQSGS